MVNSAPTIAATDHVYREHATAVDVHRRIVPAVLWLSLARGELCVTADQELWTSFNAYCNMLI